MAINKSVFMVFMISGLLLAWASQSSGAWHGPVEVISGGWGTEAGQFGLEHGDMEDGFPRLGAILSDGKILVHDDINERTIAYNSDGTVYKEIQWYIDAQKTVNPEYPAYSFWNVTGITQEGNIWLKGKQYVLKSPTGELLRTESERPLELGRVKRKQTGPETYKVTVTYPDKEWVFEGSNIPRAFFRDMNGNLYGYDRKLVIRYDESGVEIARVSVPKSDIRTRDVGHGVELVDVVFEYGEAVIAPNGDVYTWKRTPDKYSIIKWTWQEPAQ